MRIASRTFAFTLAAMLAAPSALAQARPDVRAQLPEAARKDWDAAKQLADAKDYKGALVELQRAYDLSQNPRVLYNVGVAREASHALRARRRRVGPRAQGGRRQAHARRGGGGQELDRDRAAVRDHHRGDRERDGRDALHRRLRDRQDAVRGPGADRRRQAHAQAVQGRLRRRRAAGRGRVGAEDARVVQDRAAEQDGARQRCRSAARPARRCSSTARTWVRRPSRAS